MNFEAFPKIGRLSRNCTITEKIDGTNAQVCVSETGELFVGSRTRWITPDDDNYGFARWVQEHREELLALGPGRHFGEWWGSGIQRKYGLTDGDKRFSLFNTHRWTHNPLPACCNIVPVLYEGVFTEDAVLKALDDLRNGGSHAANDFKPAEGIVIYHHGVQQYFKKTLEKDDEWKGKTA